MKNNLEYYQHYAVADQHPKFKTLRVKYGWQGEGRFWALNNRIALSDNCQLDLSKERNRGSIASDLGLSLPKFDEFIQYLSSDACALLTHVGDQIYTTDILQENLVKINETREAAKSRQDALRRKRLAEMGGNALHDPVSRVTPPSPYSSNGVTEPQSKVKESKGKETKAVPAAPTAAEIESFQDLEHHLLACWGRDGRLGLIIVQELLSLGQKHGKDNLYEAIKIAASAGKDKMNARYVKGILENNKPKPGTAPSRPAQQEHAKLFIEFFCECNDYSHSFMRSTLQKNSHGLFTCPKCKKQYTVESIIAKAGESGRADFIQTEQVVEQ